MRYTLIPLLFIVFSCHSHASERLQHNNLAELAATANKEELPILLIVSQHYCPFCVRLKEEIIYPMQISGDYTDKVIMTEIFLDSSKTIVDFNDNPTTPGELAESYNVWVTPTLLFLDHTGREIHKRMLGVNTIEMYGYYLDESLATALKAVRSGDYSYVPTDKDIKGDAPGADQLF